MDYEATIEISLNGKVKKYYLASYNGAISSESEFWNRIDEAYKEMKSDQARKQEFKYDDYIEEFDY